MCGCIHVHEQLSVRYRPIVMITRAHEFRASRHFTRTCQHLEASEQTRSQAEARTVGALIIKIGLWGILDYNHNKEPPQ